MLVARSRDIAAAEDALGEALLAALRAWPAAGVPENPDAWLLTAARRRLIDAQRREAAARTLGERIGQHGMAMQEEAMPVAAGHQIPDERLKLMFLCAHPAIDAASRTPLMLQCVLGLDAGAIASAFVVPQATMAQRLVRAKQKIRDAGMSMELPPEGELVERLEAVLGAVYAAFTAGWDARPAHQWASDLSAEAVWLGRVVARLLPDEPEAAGLLALMLYAESRRAARRDAEGVLVPLSEQDPGRWDHVAIDEAEGLLRAALAVGRPGRYQIEAAIQSAHAARRVSGETDWRGIVGLYRALDAVAPSLGADVARALAIGECDGAGRGLNELDAIDRSRVDGYQPYWAARAHLLAALGRVAEEREAYQRAIGLAEDEGVRRFLMRRLQGEPRRPS